MDYTLKKRQITEKAQVMDKDKIIRALDKVTEWSIYLLIFCVPFSKTMIEGCITIGFIAWISKKILTRDFRIKKTPLNNLLFIFFVVAAISFVNADLKMLFMRSLVSKCLKFIILYFLIVETINSKTKLKNLLKMAIISAVIVMIDGYIQRYFYNLDLFRFYPAFKSRAADHYMGFARGAPTGPFPFPNDLSAWMLMIIMPVTSLLIWGRRSVREKFALTSFLAPFLFLFYLANARSAWGGFIISFFTILSMQSKKLFLVFLVLLLSVSAIVLILPKEKTINILGLSSMQDRLGMWQIGWKAFTEHPIIGNGLNMGFRKFQEYREDEYKNKKGAYFHNGFLQIAVEMGLIGLTVFLLIIITTFKRAIEHIRKASGTFDRALCLGLTGAILAFLVHSFFDTNLQSLPLVSLFWFAMGTLFSLQNIYARKI